VEAVNPKEGALVELGRLTEIVYERARRRYTLRWLLRSRKREERAPVLAYHACDDKKCPANGKLVVVSNPRATRASAPKSLRVSYRETHWGRGGRGKMISGSVWSGRPPLVLEGEVVSVTYTTLKGTDRKSTDYEHAFGEGASKGTRVVRPTLAKGGEHLVLLGGTYVVTYRGIVG